MPVAAMLPVDQEMFQLGSSDIFCMRYPEHPWTQGLSAIALSLSEAKQPISNSLTQHGSVKGRQ